MKTQHIFGILLVAAIGVTGCKDYLDIKPKGQMIPSSTDDYRKILDYVGNKNSVGLQSTIYNTYGITNYLADDYQVADSATFKTILSNKGVPINDRGDLFRWAKEGSIYTETLEDPDWLSLYGQIFIANTALDGLPKASGSESAKNGLMAEARFHRAFCHLALVNIYAKHYTPAGAATDLGVPLRLDISLTAPLIRATVKEVYDAIITDLESAIPDLPDIQKYSHRPNKAAACALLARTYLYQGNYAKALEYANLGLTSTDFLYDFNTTLIRIPGDPLYNYFDQTITAWYDKELLCQKETCMVSGTYYRNYILSDAQTINNLYDVVNDLRFFVKFGALSGASYTYSEVTRRWGSTIGYYPIVGVTVPEMMLTRAESLARIGGAANLSAAIAELNKLRVKRYITGTYVNYVTSNYSQAQIIQLVLDERRRELLGNGLRWFDLKRLNALENANITIQRNFTGDKLAPGDKHWVMPIGRLYISKSPEIIQNEGYQ
jgi:starch-binding outer membrane protein, SusD/RagB family